ncbi:hypothetical protein GZ77_03595 [Endozoicomonas montiporae]|uniref:Uncharacterized protein n=2 Tax=Endozoicomonas montiporae TaxID=1027273 RepID=A0A081NB49_9GAMM|nr:hypothetical protein [Endozoicomonas montiporae]AMO56614.1 hypothetical protein EZMO1_2535 [Endozoicomonas montiporae CL-33]KEQ15672.1 hypothetical protein GZ77_03595 [Endozoicomonas montiporae]
MTAQNVVPTDRESTIPATDKLATAAAIYSEKTEYDLMAALESIQSLYRKQKALFVVALLTPEGMELAIRDIHGAESVVASIWNSRNLFARHHLAVQITKMPTESILDELPRSTLMRIAMKLHHVAQLAAAELEIQGEVWQ